jgi:hypothetical protein
LPTNYQPELTFLGFGSAPAFVRELEGNGSVERLIRTLKENMHRTWIVERHGYLTQQPSEQRTCGAPDRGMNPQRGASRLWIATIGSPGRQLVLTQKNMCLCELVHNPWACSCSKKQ